ncbi:hypothetical protein [Marivita sp. XM-24bin2]|uniref:hypothetical protein n=1 Tax=unclassified Marivita TaxID=2632480 RepID=UPI000D7A5D43|nr:hypothetical protein [Marivita sp. XM-24bin2]MCR9110629.1 hypothetical protein [Paracoccaceae bacterium]PWL33928.1 MAG: hypothetical protein DCO97_17025 [Marivita sp. XM-24bin2]
MAKLNKDTLFKAPQTRAETVMDKTTRIVREMLDTETEQREAKTQRLRKTRLERESSESAKTPDAKRKTGKTTD